MVDGGGPAGPLRPLNDGGAHVRNLLAKASSRPNPVRGGPRLFRCCGKVVERRVEEDKIDKGYTIAGGVEGVLAAEHVRHAMARSLKRLGSDTSELPKGKRQLALSNVAASAGVGAAAAGGGAAAAGVHAATAGAADAAKAVADERAARRRQQAQRQKLSGLAFAFLEAIRELEGAGVERGHGLEDAKATSAQLQGFVEELDGILLRDPAAFDAFQRDKGPALALAADLLKRVRKAAGLARKAAATAGSAAKAGGAAAPAGSGGSAATAGVAAAPATGAAAAGGGAGGVASG